MIPTSKPAVVAQANVPTPTPKPVTPLNVPTPKARPVMVASYQPPKAKSPMRPEAGEGDIGDDSSLSRFKAQDWTIQIGAFADSAMARAQLASYAEHSMDVLGQASRIIAPFKGIDGQTLFRARFGPFAEREAREVCARLTQRGQTCFAALATR